jgi:hypothetical protein
MSAASNQSAPQLIAAKARGTIVKIPDATAGLLMVNGNQKQFTLEGVWKSPVAPAPNMTVDIEVDDAGAITAITAVDSRQLAKEQLNKFSDKLGEIAHGQDKEGANLAKQSLGQLAARMGTVTLISTAVLWIAWFFLPGYKLDFGFLGSQTYTLWEFLGVNLEQVGTIQISHGFWAILGILAITAPFIVPFIKDPRAKFANGLPLVYSVIAIFAERSSIIKAFAGPLVPDASSVLSMQLGTYIVLAAGAVIAGRALKSS